MTGSPGWYKAQPPRPGAYRRAGASARRDGGGLARAAQLLLETDDLDPVLELPADAPGAEEPLVETVGVFVPARERRLDPRDVVSERFPLADQIREAVRCGFGVGRLRAALERLAVGIDVRRRLHAAQVTGGRDARKRRIATLTVYTLDRLRYGGRHLHKQRLMNAAGATRDASARRSAHTELLHPAAQRAGAQAERRGGTPLALDHPARALERVEDVTPLDLLERPTGGARSRSSRRGLCARRPGGRRGHRTGEQLARHLEHRATRQHDRPLNHVRELAHVPGPRVGDQAFEGPARDAVDALAELAREAVREVVREQRHVALALAQRRDRDREDV